jgi:hypothetical protein
MVEQNLEVGFKEASVKDKPQFIPSSPWNIYLLSL